jgi:urease accessory protein
MLRATKVVRRPAVHLDEVVDSITLDHVARHRRRMAMTADGGLSFLLDLDKAAVLDEGDAIGLEDGRLVAIKAAPERLVAIRTESPLRLLKVAWHLGNRHVPAELTADAIYIVEDHVLVEMVRGLGASTAVVERPFRPERGAYEEGHSHEDHHRGHHHPHEPASGSHGHGHAHDHHARPIDRP